MADTLGTSPANRWTACSCIGKLDDKRERVRHSWRMSFVALLGARPAFRRFWTSYLVSLLGDWMSFVAVSVLSLASGSGPVSLALLLAAHALPAAVLAPVAGALADRLDRRRLILGANVAQGLLTLAMALAAASGSV